MTLRGVSQLVAAAAMSLSCSSGKEAEEQPGVAAQESLASRDPCSLLPRPEAEAVLGRLATEPFRTREGTAEPDPDGPTCAYSTGAEKVFLLTPEWTYGRMNLDAERVVGGLVRQVADLPGVVADTLEGSWDDAVVGMSGELVFQKGTRSLTVAYLESSTDASGAIRLSEKALVRLAAVPEPPRPKVSADGCPLPPERVSEILAMSFRLAPRPVRLTDACSYQLEEDPTVELELSIKPVEVAELLFDGLHMRARGKLGASGADSVGLGDAGWAYGSGSGSEAAVSTGGKVYHALMQCALCTTVGSKKDAMVRLVAAMIE